MTICMSSNPILIIHVLLVICPGTDLRGQREEVIWTLVISGHWELKLLIILSFEELLAFAFCMMKLFKPPLSCVY